MKQKIAKIPSKKTKHTLREPGWFKLDNAALIYPAVSTNKWNSVYRISTVLNQAVNPEKLNQALAEVMPRFPHLNVSLNKGLFWFYFQGIDTPPTAQKDNNYPCQKMEFRRNRPLFRVLYYNKKISFEAFHSLTDGYGALAFVNVLLTRYFELSGNFIQKNDKILNHLDKATKEELEDSFVRFADLKERNAWKENKAYHIIGTNEDVGKLNLLNGIMSASKVKEVAKEYNCTVTEFLLANLFDAVLKYQKSYGSLKKPVRISLPINLRGIFPTTTLRNFSSYTNIEFSPEQSDIGLEKMIEHIKEHTKQIDKKYVMGNINANVKAQKNIFVRMLPLCIKNLVLKAVFHRVGERIFTMSFSNLGKISTPQEFSKLIDRYEVNLGPAKLNKIGATVITFEDKLVLTFASTIKETGLQKEFFRNLTARGIDILVESNFS